jgi:hypothetical protein
MNAFNHFRTIPPLRGCYWYNEEIAPRVFTRMKLTKEEFQSYDDNEDNKFSTEHTMNTLLGLHDLKNGKLYTIERKSIDSWSEHCIRNGRGDIELLITILNEMFDEMRWDTIL